MRNHAIRLLVLAGFLLRAASSSAVTIDWVHVGDPGNPADPDATCNATTSCGSVAYEYFVSRYEVTNAQYAEFLNAKAASDPLNLYNPGSGAITRSGSPGSFTYQVTPGFENKPALVSVMDAWRFTNWLANGQGNGDTETGTYTLLGGTELPSNWATVARNPGSITFLTSESEWHKAAYYDASSGSWFDFATGSNVAPSCVAPTAAANSANCGNAVGGPTDVGSYPGSPSPYGTFDQNGNAEEWTEEAGLIGWHRARGGDWVAAPSDSEFLVPPAFEVGFRVASLVPEPGTALLLMGGLAGLAARRPRPATSR